MNQKFASLAVGMAVLAFGLAGCSTVATDGSSRTVVSPDDLHCSLPTNCASSLGSANEHPLAFVGSKADGLAQLRATLQSFPEATVQGMTETTLVAIFTTPAGFKDIVEFRIDATSNRIDFRSRSGFGLFDFGKNRSRMAEFAARFAKQAVR